MRIGQFITQYPYPDQFSDSDTYFCSGAERVVRNLSTELENNGFEVHVFTSSKSTRYTHAEQDGVSVHRSPTLGSINTTEIAPTLLFDPWLHRSSPMDIVHAHNSTPPGVIAAYLYSKITGTPLLITHHGGENYEKSGSRSRRIGLYTYINYVMEPVFRYADTITVPSSGYIRESTVLSEISSNIHTIPNGIDRGRFAIDSSTAEAKNALGIDPSEFVYLFMGSHHPRKGPDVLLNAFADLHGEKPDTRLVLAGTGDLTPQLQRQAEKGPDSNIDFPGFVPEDRKATYLKAADVFVLPSVTPASEVFPLSILEAAAQGTPMIASDFPALRSIFHTYDIGMLADPADPDALRSAMRRFYSDTDLYSEYSEGAYTMACEHSWERITQQYIGLYKGIITKSNV